MKTWRRFLSRLAALVSTRRDEARLREEVEEHIALQTAENIRAGLSPVEARRQALLKFGPVEAIKERYRDQRRLTFLEHACQDVHYTMRQLRKAPLFTIAATLSLAVGIGANAAVFTVVDRVLLRSLPIDDPHELVTVTDQQRREGNNQRFSYPFYAVFRDNNVLKGSAARFAIGFTATIDRQVLRARGELVSGNYFAVVGAAMQLGRPLTADDDRTPGSHPVAVISDAFWRRSFASNPSALGRGVLINGHPFTIIGVAREGFTGTDVGSPADIWLPMAMQREIGRDLLGNAETNWLEIIGRLESGVSVERAGAELTEFIERARAPRTRLSGTDSRRLALLPAGSGNLALRREIGPALRVLQFLTAFALALACVNVASLLAVRSAARQKEIAVRLALGAGRSRLARQFLTETLVLAGLGGMAGLLMAPWAAGLLVASQQDRLGIDPSLDLRVFLFGVAISVVAGLFVAQAPILGSRKIGVVEAFRSSSLRPFGTYRRLTVHDVIITCQIAVSLAMLISAALLVQSLRGLGSVDLGFQAADLLLVSVDPKSAGYDQHRVAAFWRDSLDRVSGIPGVRTVSLAGTVPLAPTRQRQPFFDPILGAFVEIDTNFVGPGYFRTLGIPLLGGREFDDRDVRASREVVIVNERLARMFWPGESPIGKGVRMAGGRNELRQKGPLEPSAIPLPEVVGVVKDVKYRDLRGEAGPMLYRPLFQTGSTDAMTLHVRGTGDATTLAATIRREMQALDANVPLFAIKTLEDQLNASFAQTRQAAVLTGGFGILALLLSGIGVYGVTALAVSRQTHEIGIRMALGARPRDIVRLTGRRGLALVAVGLGLGLMGSFGFTRIADALLYGVSASDSATFVAMFVVLALVSLTAIFIPATRATRLDALGAIRRE